MTARRAIRVVPHTHWDREWYLTFEEFRDRLVEAMDSLLELLRRGDHLFHFHLDGQTAMVDDYLSVRPEREKELAAYIASGRLSCGPWVALVDEFLVSGESILRNLEDGMARAEALGGSPTVAYLPDQFGHVGQMPQLLTAAGLDRVVVWRGVPAEIDETTFTWSAPDGSTVAALYLPFGYGQGGKLPPEPDAFLERLGRELERSDPFLRPDEPLLLMAGADHERPNASLPELIEHAGSIGFDIAFTSLEAHMESLPPPRLSWTGELRSAARADLLPNTYSGRAPQKAERARAEHLLERYAEPLAALVPGAEWPAAELDRAWHLLHLNGAHDSVCGCTTDDVARAVDERTRRATDLARAIAHRALGALGASENGNRLLAFNPSHFERDGIPGLGWALLDERPPEPAPVALHATGDGVAFEIDGVELTVTFDDQADVGDLYTFSHGGGPKPPRSIECDGEIARVLFEDVQATLSVAAVDGEVFARVEMDVDNRAPDHRLRAVLRLPEPAASTLAMAPFELVARPPLGEGGRSEPPSPFWPARGVVMAGGVGFLSEGVFEYELIDEERLAFTLLRCVGTISRPEPLETRKNIAGPDVATPGAQMIGKNRIAFGVLAVDPGEGLLKMWERYALPPMIVSCDGSSEAGARGTLLDLDVPALSSVRRKDDHVVARVWNPWDRSIDARVGGRRLALGPHRIESIELDR
ncbi:MAG: hypothetical protein ACRDKB_09815 [Actinomycetota bacterium]